MYALITTHPRTGVFSELSRHEQLRAAVDVSDALARRDKHSSLCALTIDDDGDEQYTELPWDWVYRQLQATA